MVTARCWRVPLPLKASVALLIFLLGPSPACSFFSAPALYEYSSTSTQIPCSPRSFTGNGDSFMIPAQRQVIAAPRHRRTKGGATMERPRGQFRRLTKPKFDRRNPSAVGEVAIPGLQEVCVTAQTQLFPRREVMQFAKDRIRAWCAEENRREQEGVSLGGKVPSEDRPRRTWRAYEFVQLPARNRTLDSEVLGMNVGLAPNDTRLEVIVDYGSKDEAPEVGSRLLDMVADVSREANEVFGYEDDASTGGKNLGPWKKAGNVNSWRKWLHVESDEPLPESAVTLFRVVQANWASPEKIAAAMNFTVSWSKTRHEESATDPTVPLRSVEVLHSAVHPHVLKIVETFASADALLDHFHRHYADFLEGIFDFRAAVNPTVQAYTPLAASVRPSLSARLPSGAMVPLVAIGGTETETETGKEEGRRAPSMDVIFEGLKLGVRHVVLEAGSAGVEEAVEALRGALAFGVLRRSDLFVTLLVGEDRARLSGGAGIAAAVRETLACDTLDSSRDGEGQEGRQRLLENVDALIVARDSGRLFDDNGSFLELWDEAREAAACFPVPLHETNGDAAQARPPPLARHLGIGGHGPRIAEKFSLLAETQVLAVERAQSSQRDGSSSARVEKIQDTVLPDLFFGDLRAGAGAATAKTIEFCRERGVQTFSMRYIGGQGGKEAWRGATAAADYEHEDITADEVLAKWVLELGSGVVWRPTEVADVARTLPFARYFLPVEWITEIVYRAGCSPEAWATTLSRLLPPGGTPTEEELEAEADEMISRLMEAEDPRGEDDEDVDEHS